MTVLLINIKMIFRHLDATLPKWLLRTCTSSLHVPIPLVHLLPGPPALDSHRPAKFLTFAPL